jgi:hypothetical protein
MVEYVFTLDDLARLRFAISPPWQLVTSLRALRESSSAGVHLEWVRSVRGMPAGLTFGRRSRCWPGRTTPPDFLTPPPGSPLASIEDGLEVNRLVKALAEYWERAFAPSWPRVRALLEADTSAEIAELHMDPQT